MRNSNSPKGELVDINRRLLKDHFTLRVELVISCNQRFAIRIGISVYKTFAKEESSVLRNGKSVEEVVLAVY